MCADWPQPGKARKREILLFKEPGACYTETERGGGEVRLVKCHECGKHYDYDEDAFCPRCGAFNQPEREARIGQDGRLIRRDGLNEKGHAGSFVHEEFHEEARERKNSVLHKGISRGQRGAVHRSSPASQSSAQAGEAAESAGKKQTGKPIRWVRWIVGAIILLNLLTSCVAAFLQ